MDEFKFVLKCFLFAVAIVLFSQVKIENQTLENKAEMFLQDSPASQFIREAAEGGVKVINQSLQATQSFFKRKVAQAGGKP